MRNSCEAGFFLVICRYSVQTAKRDVSPKNNSKGLKSMRCFYRLLKVLREKRRGTPVGDEVQNVSAADLSNSSSRLEKRRVIAETQEKEEKISSNITTVNDCEFTVGIFRWVQYVGVSLEFARTTIISSEFRLDAEKCRFIKCEFKGVLLRLEPATCDVVFENCTFQHGAKLKGNLNAVRFIGCHFESSALANDAQGQPSFRSCRFSGTCPLHGISVSAEGWDIDSHREISRVTRAARWNVWYQAHPILGWPMRFFWTFTEYGTTVRPLLLLAMFQWVAFAAVYTIDSYEHASMLTGMPTVVSVESYVLLTIRCLYFSAVVSSTVGFGDIHPQESSIPGHILVTSQILFSYFLIASLISRFSNWTMD